jgi:hypothetical protein
LVLLLLLTAGCGGGAGGGEASYLRESEDGLTYVEWSRTEGNAISGRIGSLYMDESGSPLEQKDTFKGTVNDGNVTLDIANFDSPVLGEVRGAELVLEVPANAGTTEIVFRESSKQEVERKSGEMKERLEAQAAKEAPVPKSWAAAHPEGTSGGDGGGSESSDDEGNHLGSAVQQAQIWRSEATKQALDQESWAAANQQTLRALREALDRVKRLAPKVKAEGASYDACFRGEFEIDVLVPVTLGPPHDQQDLERTVRITREAADDLRSEMQAADNRDDAYRKLADETDAAAERLKRALEANVRSGKDLKRNIDPIYDEAEKIRSDAGC